MPVATFVVHVLLISIQIVASSHGRRICTRLTLRDGSMQHIQSASSATKSKRFQTIASSCPRQLPWIPVVKPVLYRSRASYPDPRPGAPDSARQTRVIAHFCTERQSQLYILRFTEGPYNHAASGHRSTREDASACSSVGLASQSWGERQESREEFVACWRADPDV